MEEVDNSYITGEWDVLTCFFLSALVLNFSPLLNQGRPIAPGRRNIKGSCCRGAAVNLYPHEVSNKINFLTKTNIIFQILYSKSVFLMSSLSSMGRLKDFSNSQPCFVGGSALLMWRAYYYQQLKLCSR